MIHFAEILKDFSTFLEKPLSTFGGSEAIDFSNLNHSLHQV
jgi:hypothetical protein